MRSGSRAYLILAVTFFFVALIWFFWIKNTVSAILWAAAAAVELVVFLAVWRKEQKDEDEDS